MAVAAASAAVAAAEATAPALADRLRGILVGAAIADALASPAHWYYDTRALRRDYGVIKDFVKPRADHAGSIMGLSNTGGAGRGSTGGPHIIGDVINHGKRSYWRSGAHYHATLAKGENTLNMQVNRMHVRTMAAAGKYSEDGFLAAYERFMTTPGSHNDAYAESYHRLFFQNRAAGKDLRHCAGDDGHNIASMGGFVMLPPVAALAALRSPGGAAAAAGGAADDIEAAAKAAGEAAGRHVLLTHKSESLRAYAEVYGALVARVLLGVPLRDALQVAGRAVGIDPASLAARDSVPYSTACYIEDSFPWLCFLAAKHGGDAEAALIANVMAGGENAHRGAALGALIGAAQGASAFPARWREGLHDASAIAAEADAFAALAIAPASTKSAEL
ncbi:hypothetical protein FNF27_01612 [Cafeteria roenbergensis]|uniref:ADP-ribosylglycohydrolase n=2 Tax=Cafeteria roenbergensis TaxID=33653 RepID=A0A5A8CIF8_CAFRO|nr:hypothetical protein FNF29_03985 [Cafeteria roenbergensis]KAA0167861.1 hypothetical protein FNF31_00796 [Cafeteria roenbergensis]KAA0171595.1 hypothetical protein FNF28_00528 [Cafeteria roenbergensis]KAA0176790.1 hypothetical protein FNF27_01612 [Cafeteria roenbergensis]|eukprot:KAA0152419.1 hypothetical protein FNF29_03985 [Cafeteria roenbergensis]